MANEDLLLRAFSADADPEEPTSTFGRIGDVYSALAWRFLFWPDCFVVHDAVFLALNGNDVEYVGARLRPFLSEVDDARWQDAVASFNYYEVPYLFFPPRSLDDESAARAYRDVAEALRDSWSARLAQLYPERSFSVVVEEPDDALALRVTIRQEAAQPRS